MSHTLKTRTSNGPSIVVGSLVIVLFSSQLFKIADTRSTTTPTDSDNVLVQTAAAADNTAIRRQIGAQKNNVTANVDVADAQLMAATNIAFDKQDNGQVSKVDTKAATIAHHKKSGQIVVSEIHSGTASPLLGSVSTGKLPTNEQTAATNKINEETFLESPPIEALTNSFEQGVVTGPIEGAHLSDYWRQADQRGPRRYSSKLAWLLANIQSQLLQQKLHQQEMPQNRKSLEQQSMEPVEHAGAFKRFRRTKRSLTIWRKMSQVLARKQQPAPVAGVVTRQPTITTTSQAPASASNELYNDRNYYKTISDSAMNDDQVQQSLRQQLLEYHREKNQLMDSNSIYNGGQQQPAQSTFDSQQYLASSLTDSEQQQQQLAGQISKNGFSNASAQALQSLVVARRRKQAGDNYDNHAPIRFNNCFFNSISCF